MTEIHPAAVRYDRDHDVLRLHFSSSEKSISSSDETFPGIYIDRSETTEAITGVMVFDYSRRSMRELELLLPIVEWKDIKGTI